MDNLKLLHISLSTILAPILKCDIGVRTKFVSECMPWSILIDVCAGTIILMECAYTFIVDAGDDSNR